MNKWERAVRMESLDLLIIFTVFLLFFTCFALQSDSGNLTKEANCYYKIICLYVYLILRSTAAAPMIEMVKLLMIRTKARLVSFKETF